VLGASEIKIGFPGRFRLRADRFLVSQFGFGEYFQRPGCPFDGVLVFSCGDSNPPFPLPFNIHVVNVAQW